MNKIFTIGHSTRTAEDFFSLLEENAIKILADVRRFPGSKKYPQFNRDILAESCKKNGINYFHLEKLGGRRQPLPSSKNTAWKNASFRGYADYQETEDYQKSIDELILLAQKSPTAYMCSEALWWKCHRSLISDDLKKRGWKVIHILGKNKTEEHPFSVVERQKQLF
jgi:uncharacterized protein (DUF488 family)